MKTKFIFNSIIALFLCANSTGILGQSWNQTGNTVNSGDWFGADTSSDEPVSFEHKADDDASSFIWSTTTSTTLLPRMILTRPGWLGLNTTSPNCLYEVLDGSVMFRNSLSALDLEKNWPLPPIGSVPFSGGGIRLMWLDSIGAFRAGKANHTIDLQCTHPPQAGRVKHGYENTQKVFRKRFSPAVV